MSLVSASRATSRRTGSKPDQDDRLGGVVDDQVDAGRLLERADVAALAADDPALHLVAGQVDDGDGVLGGVVGGDALHRGDDDLAGLLLGLLAGAPLDRPGELDRVVLGLLADRLEEDALGVLGGHARDPLEGGDLLLVEPGELLALVLELALAVDDLAALLLEHVGALVELLVARRAGGARGSGARSRFARASSSASRCRRSFSSFASRIRSFCWVRASATIRAALSWAALMVWLATTPRATNPTATPTTAATTAATTTIEFHLQFLPSGGDCAPEALAKSGSGYAAPAFAWARERAGPFGLRPLSSRCRGSPGARPSGPRPVDCVAYYRRPRTGRGVEPRRVSRSARTSARVRRASARLRDRPQTSGDEAVAGEQRVRPLAARRRGSGLAEERRQALRQQPLRGGLVGRPRLLVRAAAASSVAASRRSSSTASTIAAVHALAPELARAGRARRAAAPGPATRPRLARTPRRRGSRARRAASIAPSTSSAR